MFSCVHVYRVHLVFQRLSFPCELLEPILAKAVIGLYASHRVRLLPRADVIAVVTVSRVCAEWRGTIIRGCQRNHKKIIKILKCTRVGSLHTCNKL
jgi:hypothetical protein